MGKRILFDAMSNNSTFLLIIPVFHLSLLPFASNKPSVTYISKVAEKLIDLSMTSLTGASLWESVFLKLLQW